MTDDLQPPGSLSTLGKIWEGFKHVAGKALKWAAIGALIGGVMLGALPALGAIASSAFSFVPVVGPWLASLGTEGMVAAFTTGAIGLGTVTGIIGALTGLGGASEAVDQAEDRSISNVTRAQNRMMQMAAMEQQYTQKQIGLAAQAQQLGVPTLPGMGPGMGGRGN